MNKFTTPLFLLALSACLNAQSVSLKLAPPVGKSFTYGATYKTQSANSAGAGGGVPGMSADMSMQASILSRNAKGTKIRMKVLDVKSSNQAMAEQAKGTTMEAVYNSRGIVVGEAQSSDPRTGQMMGQLGAMGVGFLGVVFPSGPVSTGSKWSTTFDIGKIFGTMLPGMMQSGKKTTIPVAFRLAKVETKGGKRLATISYMMKGTVDMSVSAGGNPGQPAQSTSFSVNMNIGGTIVVDAATGMPRTGSSKGTIGVNLSQGINIVQNVTTSFKQK